MKNYKSILYVLLLLFTVLMPLIPSTAGFMGMPLSGDVLLYITILYFFILLIRKREKIRLNREFYRDYLNVFMISWVILMFISIVYSRDKLTAFNESQRLGAYVILFFMVKYHIADIKVYKNILIAYMFTVFIVAVLGIIFNFYGIGTFEQGSLGSEVRIASTLENSNNMGAFFVFAIFPFIVLFIKEKVWRKKLIYSVLIVLSMVNIIISYSRNALLGLAFGIGLLIVTFSIKYIVFITVPAVLSLILPNVSSRIGEIFDLSQNLSRIKLWKVAALIIRDHPILGVGNGNYPRYYFDYAERFKYIKYNPSINVHPHNAFLKAFTEMGILGFAVFTGMIVNSFKAVYDFTRERKADFYGAFYSGFLISLGTFVFMNIIDSFFSSPKVIVYYFLLLGVCEGIKKAEVA